MTHEINAKGHKWIVSEEEYKSINKQLADKKEVVKFITTRGSYVNLDSSAIKT